MWAKTCFLESPSIFFYLSFYLYFSTLLKDWLKIKVQVVHSVNFHCFYEQKQVISHTVTIAIAVGVLLVLREGSRVTDNTSIATLRYLADTNLSPDTAFWWKIWMPLCLHFDLWAFLNISLQTHGQKPHFLKIRIAESNPCQNQNHSFWKEKVLQLSCWLMSSTFTREQ